MTTKLEDVREIQSPNGKETVYHLQDAVRSFDNASQKD